MSRLRRRAASFVVIGGTSILSLVLLRVAAERIPLQGLKTLDDFITGRS